MVVLFCIPFSHVWGFLPIFLIHYQHLKWFLQVFYQICDLEVCPPSLWLTFHSPSSVFCRGKKDEAQLIFLCCFLLWMMFSVSCIRTLCLTQDCKDFLNTCLPFSFVINSHPSWCKMLSHFLKKFISLVTDAIEHIFMCFFVNYILSLVNSVV